MYHWLKSLESPEQKYSYDSDEELLGEIVKGKDEGEKVKPSTSKITTLNINKEIDDDYKTFLEGKDLPLPSKIIDENMDLDDIMKKTKQKLKRSEDYIKEHSTKKGKPYATLKESQKTIYKRNTDNIQHLKDYIKRLENIKDAQKYIGSITSRCSGKEPALLPRPDTRERRKSSLKIYGSRHSYSEKEKRLQDITKWTVWWFGHRSSKAAWASQSCGS